MQNGLSKHSKYVINLDSQVRSSSAYTGLGWFPYNDPQGATLSRSIQKQVLC